MSNSFGHTPEAEGVFHRAVIIDTKLEPLEDNRYKFSMLFFSFGEPEIVMQGSLVGMEALLERLRGETTGYGTLELVFESPITGMVAELQRQLIDVVEPTDGNYYEAVRESSVRIQVKPSGNGPELLAIGNRLESSAKWWNVAWFKHLMRAADLTEGRGKPGRVYVGKRDAADEFAIAVYVDEGGARKPLPHVGNHSESFEWGYGGSGPADLAWSILAHHLQDPARAERLHQAFKGQVVAHLSKEGFRIPEQRVADWCREQTAAN